MSLVLLTLFLLGCHAQPPGGVPIQPQTLGSSVDEINRVQEENAELAKFIVYAHEFEINLQHEQPTAKASEPDNESTFQYQPPPRVRGIRLTPDGQDHVRQIAKYLQHCDGDPGVMIVVERSQTSKQWDTKHNYPVHFNDELDSLRRGVVIRSLVAQGVTHAADLVIVAPAYPTGLNAEEAAGAYDNSIGTFGRSLRNGVR